MTMSLSIWISGLRATGVFFSALLCAGLASGQYRDKYPDDTGELRQTVARISYISGNVSFARGDDPDNWQTADRNVPMSLGDRVYTDNRSRLELQVHGGDSIRLGAGSELAALNLTEDAKQFSVSVGVASFHIWRLDDNETFEVDTPNAAVTFDRPGDYRIDVDADGNTRIVVRRGRATVAAGGGQVGVSSGEQMQVDGIDDPRYDVVNAARPDSWDRWIDERESRIARARSRGYVSADVVGLDDLDEYGRWQEIPQYGRVWTPAAVESDWAPYRAGHWIWQDPWGWTWVSSEPWGWAPYHYGRWVNSSSRWYWVPVASGVRYVRYSPALVVFVGGGSGWSASASFGGRGEFVGWFPLAPREQMIPWWGRRRAAEPSVDRASYANRMSVTVVNHNTFVSGGVVTNNTVRDRAVLREVAAAPVLRGPIPIMPTRESLRVSVRADLPPPPRPPAALIERSVVVRTAPPPAPPSFQAKVDVIREGRGAPIEPDAAARLAVTDRGRARATTTVRPAAAEPGRVTLAPRSPNAGTAATQPRPEPVAPVPGRPMATAERPVAPAPPSTTAGPAGSAPPPAAPPPDERARQQNEQWRGRQRPPDTQPSATPQPQPEPQSQQPPARGREGAAPPPERVVVPPARTREQQQQQQQQQPPGQARESAPPQPERATPPPPQPREAATPPPKPQPEAERAKPARGDATQGRPVVERERQRPAEPEKKPPEKDKEKEKKDKKAQDEKDKKAKDEKDKKDEHKPD